MHLRSLDVPHGKLVTAVGAALWAALAVVIVNPAPGAATAVTALCGAVFDVVTGELTLSVGPVYRWVMTGSWRRSGA